MKVFFKERWLDVLSWLVAVMTIAFALANHAGWIDQARGLHAAEEVADRFDLSYGPGASAPIYSADAAWPAMLRVINEYSRADIQRDRTPVVLARFKAITSAVDTTVPGTPQWTAPATQIALIYRMWPDPGSGNISPNDYRIVGSIQDLHDWIKRDSDDFHFWGSDVLLALMTLLIAVGTTVASRHEKAKALA